MKTKEFIERVESNLFTVRESHDGTIIFIHPSRSDFNILAWVNKYENESHIYSVLPKELAESLLAYTMTPIEEREEEKKYVYELPVLDWTSERLFLYKTSHEYKKLRVILREYLMDKELLYFTDKEVEEYAVKERALFKACKKIEVTP